MAMLKNDKLRQFNLFLFCVKKNCLSPRGLCFVVTETEYVCCCNVDVPVSVRIVLWKRLSRIADGTYVTPRSLLSFHSLSDFCVGVTF